MRLILVFLVLLLVGCASNIKKSDVKPISKENPLNYELVSKSILVQEDKHRSLTFYYPKRLRNVGLFYLASPVNLEPYISMSSKKGAKPNLLLRAMYIGDGWVFMNNISILCLADNKKIKEYNLNRSTVDRKVISGGTVSETVHLALDTGTMNKMINCSNISVRFSGKTYVDGIYKSDDKKGINLKDSLKEMVFLYKDLSGPRKFKQASEGK